MARVILTILALGLLAISAKAAVVREFPPFEQLRLLENPTLRAETRDDVTYRLPNNTEPVSYDIELWTDVHKGDTAFRGQVAITLKVLETSTIITVHQRQLEKIEATIRKTGAGAADIKLDIDEDKDREFLKLSAKDVTFDADTEWLLTIKYEGKLRGDNGGFYMSSYTDEKGATKYLATTQFESTDARHAFPCYDEPAKRAIFTITIHHDPSYNAISNMPVNAAKSTAGVTAFQPTEKMSSYIIAFIVSEYVYSEGNLNDVPQRVYSRKGTENEQEWALLNGLLVEKRLSGYFGVPFALPKLDQAAIPDFAAGAMENWGLATYREEYLLYNTVNSTTNTQTNIATIEAHEDAHMWFGDLVAIEWWTYLWLKEGFATLFEHLAVDLAYPEWDIFQIFHAASYQNALLTDANPNVRAMTHFVETPAQIGQLYDSIAYAKAGSVLDMWRNALTNTVFQRGLHNYLETNKFSAANETHLFDAIALAAREEKYEVPEQIHNMLASWTLQGGVPLLNVKRDYAKGTFSVEQEQFTNNKNFESNKLWYIPLNYAEQSNPDFRNTEATNYLLKVKSINVEDAKLKSDDWLIVNKQSTGYYRINYDEQNWRLIIAGLLNRPHKIHPRNRAQLIGDAYRLSTTDRLSHGIMLELLTYLPQETQYAPWSAANTVVTLLNRYLSGDSEYEQFKTYVNQLVSNQYDIFGINDVHGEQHLAKFTRNVVINVACSVGQANCLSETKDKLQQLVEKNTPIEPNLQSPVYCNGLKEATNATFDFVYDKLMNSNDQAERRLLIASLGCAQDASQLQKYVSSSIDQNNKLRTQERYTLLNPTYSRGEAGLMACIEFLLVNWEAYGNLNAGFGGVNPLYADLLGMSTYVVNENQKVKYQELLDKVKGSPFVPDTLQASADTTIQGNMDWLKANREPIVNWVADYLRSGSSTISASILALFACLLAIKMF